MTPTIMTVRIVHGKQGACQTSKDDIPQELVQADKTFVCQIATRKSRQVVSCFSLWLFLHFILNGDQNSTVIKKLLIIGEMEDWQHSGTLHLQRVT